MFAQNKQTEQPDYWIQKESWLTKTEVQYPVQFGKLSVMSRMYDIDVTGYEGRVNKLHLFDIDTVDEKIPMHDGIDFDKNAIEKNLTLVFIPGRQRQSRTVIAHLPAVFYGKQRRTVDSFRMPQEM